MQSDIRQLTAMELGQHVRDAAKHMADQFAKGIERDVHFTEDVLRVTKSPIEAIFFVWFYAYRGLLMSQDHGDELTWWRLFPQMEVQTSDAKSYILDFEVAPDRDHSGGHWWHDAKEKFGASHHPIAVELDGYEFHERTKEQVDYRNERDRALARDGWVVLHFSGRQVTQKPWECAADVFKEIDRQYTNVMNHIWPRTGKRP